MSPDPIARHFAARAGLLADMERAHAERGVAPVPCRGDGPRRCATEFTIHGTCKARQKGPSDARNQRRAGVAIHSNLRNRLWQVSP